SSPNPWADSPPVGNFGPQFGTSQRIQINDASIQNVVYRNGSLWCAQAVFLPAAGPTRSSIQWWQINPASNVIQQRGRIDDASGNVFYGFPSIAVNKNNDVLIGYARFSASQYAGAGYAYRASTDTLNTLRDDTTLKAGEGLYLQLDDFGRNRWGDYSGTTVDPSNDTDMWTLQEYATLFNTWSTWWGRINGGAGTSCSYSISPTSNPVSAGSTTGSVTVTTTAGCNWTATSNASWLTITSGSSGSGNGTVNYSVASNTTTSPRTGTMTIAGLTFTVTQAGVPCTYSISPSSQSFSSAAGTGSVSVTDGAGCNWAATSNSSFITISSGSSGTGNGTVNYSVAANTATSQRTGTMTIARQPFPVTQAAN